MLNRPRSQVIVDFCNVSRKVGSQSSVARAKVSRSEVVDDVGIGYKLSGNAETGEGKTVPYKLNVAASLMEARPMNFIPAASPSAV